MNEQGIRQHIIDLCLQMNATGLNQGTSGNIRRHSTLCRLRHFRHQRIVRQHCCCDAGTQRLSACQSRLVVAGTDLDKAMWAAVELETLSSQYFHARLAGDIKLLPDEEITTVLEKFKNYGPKDASRDSSDGYTLFCTAIQCKTSQFGYQYII